MELRTRPGQHNEEGPQRLPGRAPFGMGARARETVQLPTWVVDEVLAPAKPIAFRLVVMLFRHGWDQVGPDGRRRVWWRGTVPELSRLIGASKPHVIEAERHLAAAGFLTIHERTGTRAPHAISAPVDRPTGNNLLPVAEPESAHHDDDLLIPFSPSGREEITTTTPAARETICDRFAAYGVTSPPAWLARFGPARCEEVLDHFESLSPERFTNPPGFLYRLLTSGQRFPPRTATYDPGSFEAQKARYLGGRLGHVVKYK